MATHGDAKQVHWQKLFGYLMGNQAVRIADIGLPNLEEGAYA